VCLKYFWKSSVSVSSAWKSKMSREQVSDQELLSTLLCPICPSYLCPPIQVCTNGHSLCPSCFERAKPQCPKCPGRFINRRCFILERIHAKLFIPCKNQKYGCTFASKGLRIKRHEKKCLWKFLGRELRDRHVWTLCQIKIQRPKNKKRRA
jgi:hypothetical protein